MNKILTLNGTNPTTFNYDGAEDTLFIKDTGTYRIDTFGAQGGHGGGLGGEFSADFQLEAGTTLQIIIGGSGDNGGFGDGFNIAGTGGGGATGVSVLTDLSSSGPVILIGAGGGGGSDYNRSPGGSGGTSPLGGPSSGIFSNFIGMGGNGSMDSQIKERPGSLNFEATGGFGTYPALNFSFPTNVISRNAVNPGDGKVIITYNPSKTDKIVPIRQFDYPNTPYGKTQVDNFINKLKDPNLTPAQIKNLMGGETVPSGFLDASGHLTAKGESALRVTLEKKGCYLSSLAMAINALDPGTNEDPSKLINQLPQDSFTTIEKVKGWNKKNTPNFGTGLNPSPQKIRTVLKSIDPSLTDEKGITDASKIREAVTMGNPVLLNVKNGGHWVLATGVKTINGEDIYDVIDPGNAIDSKSSSNFNGFKTLKQMKFTKADIIKKESNPSLNIQGKSPIDLVIIDPNGKKIGYDPISNLQYNDISNSYYSLDYSITDPDDEYTPEQLVADRPDASPLAVINSIVPGNYTIKVFGVGDGEYHIDLDTDNGTNIIPSTTFGGNITKNEEIDYQVTVDSSLHATIQPLNNILPPISNNTKSPQLTQPLPNLLSIEGGTEKSLLKLTNIAHEGIGKNEAFAFVVDDKQGRIGGIMPGTAGYLKAALDRSQVIFSNLGNNPLDRGFDLNSQRYLKFTPGDLIAFGLVADDSLNSVKAALSAGKSTSQVLFSLPGANDNNSSQTKFTALPNNSGYQIAWANTLDNGKPNRAFNDMVLKVETLDNFTTPIGTNLQTKPEGAVIDLRNFTGQTLKVDTVSVSDAAYNNYIGFYAVEDTLGTLANGLKVGDVGYAEAAIKSAVLRSSKTESLSDRSITGGKIFAPVMVANGTFEDFLKNNPQNKANSNVNAYFNYLGANTDKVDHFRLLGDNKFGVEDLYGGGDRDYNDIVFQMTIKS